MNTIVLPKMTRSFIAPSLFCLFVVGPAQPATSQQAQKAPRSACIPPEVRAKMTANGRSLYLASLSSKKGTPPLIMHAWVEDKPAPSCCEGEEDKLRFHIDFFSRKNSKWQLSLPVSYLSHSPVAPFDSDSWGRYEWHWLDAEHKEGLIIVGKVTRSTDASIWLVTLPKGVPINMRPTPASYSVQEFGESYAGGGTTRITFVAEVSGKMAIVRDELSHGGHERSIYGWRGGQWQEVRTYSDHYKILESIRRSKARLK